MPTRRESKPPAPKAKPNGKDKAKVLVVDDHPVVRQGLTLLVNAESDMAICGEAETPRDALKAIADLGPDAAIVDLSLKGASGLELIKDIKVRFPRLPVLVLSMSDEAVYAERALRAGARGYMMKEEATEKVLDALRQVLGGGIYLSQSMSARLLHQLVEGAPPDGGSPVDRLSDRELEVFQLIGQGLGTTEIARHLHLSPKTIETYRAHIKDKLGLDSATELLQHAIQHVQETGGA
jgi:DNA-binding NarL/FixJ family response regulator